MLRENIDRLGLLFLTPEGFPVICALGGREMIAGKSVSARRNTVTLPEAQETYDHGDRKVLDVNSRPLFLDIPMSHRTDTPPQPYGFKSDISTYFEFRNM